MKISTRQIGSITPEQLFTNIIRGVLHTEFLRQLRDYKDILNTGIDSSEEHLKCLTLLRGGALRHNSEIDPRYQCPVYDGKNIDISENNIFILVGREPDILRFSVYRHVNLPPGFKPTGVIDHRDYAELDEKLQPVFGSRYSSLNEPYANRKARSAIEACLGLVSANKRVLDSEEHASGDINFKKTYKKEHLGELLKTMPFYKMAIEGFSEVEDFYNSRTEFSVESRIGIMGCPGLAPPFAFNKFLEDRTNGMRTGRMPLLIHDPERLLSSIIALLVYNGQDEKKRESMGGAIAAWLYDLHNISYALESKGVEIDQKKVQALTMLHLVAMSGEACLPDVFINNPLELKYPFFLKEDMDRSWLVEATKKEAGMLLPYIVEKPYVEYGLNSRIKPTLEAVFPGFGKDPQNIFGLNEAAIEFTNKLHESFKYWFGAGCGSSTHHSTLKFDCDKFEQGFPGVLEKIPDLPYRAMTMIMRTFLLAKELGGAGRK